MSKIYPRSRWHIVPLTKRVLSHWSDRPQIGGRWVWWKVWQ
jgi:hypothetical protein